MENSKDTRFRTFCYLELFIRFIDGEAVAQG